MIKLKLAVLYNKAIKVLTIALHHLRDSCAAVWAVLQPGLCEQVDQPSAGAPGGSHIGLLSMITCS